MKQIKILTIGQGFMGGIAHPRGILEERFDTIRRFVGSRKNPGELLGQELLERMKEELRKNVKRK